MESALLAFCSTRRTVVPSSLSDLMMSKISCTRMGARPMDGSSSMMSLGLLMSARPIASICCSPPESVAASWLRRSFRRGKRSYTSRRVSRASSSGRVNAPISRFSRTVRLPKTRRPSGQSAMPRDTILCAGTPTRLSPSNSIEPVRGRKIPATVFSVVDLPAPLAPMSVTISPALTSNDTPLTAWIDP